jgi:hypothetical protein
MCKGNTQKTNEPLHREGIEIARRKTIKQLIFGSVALLLPMSLVKKAEAGYGRCSQCSCQAYQNSYKGDNMCGNCGHNYGAHY